MDRVLLDPTPVRTTQLGFGCASLMRLPLRRRRQDLLAAAFDADIRHFDVARMYGLGAAEAELGRFARGRRDRITIATKFGIEARPASWMSRLQGPARALIGRYPALRRLVKQREGTLHEPRRYDVAAARESLERSLRELGTDYVDVFFVHAPLGAGEVPLAELRAFLDAAREKGTIRAWGVAGEEPRVVGELARSMPPEAVVQVREGVFDRGAVDFGSHPRIAFGLLSSALERILAHVGASRSARQRWGDALGADCADPDVVASLLLSDGLAGNPGGVVLYATTKPERLAPAAALAEHPAPALGAFRELVRADFPPPAL